ncbi:MAG: nucleotidyltransferase domain-containing protein [Candidatus Caldarchaeum sp.]|uniref:Nucleotidyltransferase domain-containing protein n=1 Tax=Caldiarchaeum subterraneum TaxID=311458 RepID=A0A7C4E396_CALS0|nr:nucleotidyltransferase domain-containing protein [Candidatus Caldarchaeales archaeon]
MGIVEERRLMRKAATEAAAEAVKLVEMIVGSVSAALIGSYARGDFNQWSDVDLLVVSPGFAPNPLDRFEQVAEVLKKFPSLEIIPLTLREFERQKRLKTPLAEETMRTGVVIKDELGIFLNKPTT